MQNRSGLHLVTGPDQLFVSMAGMVFAAGLAAIWLSRAGFAWNIAVTLIAFLAYLLLARHTFRQPSVDLQLLPDRRVYRAGGGRNSNIGLMQNKSWSCGLYAVICVDTPGRPTRFLISRSRQQADMYRVMMSWLVLGHPDTKERELS